jgi:hypothetical protein
MTYYVLIISNGNVANKIRQEMYGDTSKRNKE